MTFPKGAAGQLTIEPWMISPEVSAVFAALMRDGKEARFIGGCVRNALMHLPIHDIDIATQETPDRVVNLLEGAGIRAVPTGIEHGTITIEELANAMALPAGGHAVADAPEQAAARFKAGDRVRVRELDPPGHIRTPWYCRGREGEVLRFCGVFRNPEELAYANPEDKVSRQPLYSVRFSASQLWPGFAENSSDSVNIEIYQHWLEPAT